MVLSFLHICLPKLCHVLSHHMKLRATIKMPIVLSMINAPPVRQETCSANDEEFIEIAFKLKGFEISWKGEGINEIGYDNKTGKELIFIDSKYFRPAEVEQLLGDCTKATNVLGWKPKTKFIELVKEMVEQDCN